MIETILTTVLSSALILKNPTISPKPQIPQTTFTRVLPQKNYVSYVAAKDENLGDVALRYYGSADYWTNLWNDNPEIADPDAIEGKTIIINVNKTDKSSDLTPELAVRQENLNQKKKQDYLQSIGYLRTTTKTQAQVTTVAALVATAAPTQAPAQIAAGSPISEEAINYLGSCEAGMDPTKNTGNGYYGAFQFSAGTWNRMNTGYERADLAPIEVQKAAVKQLISGSSIYSQFPACASRMRGAGLI